MEGGFCPGEFDPRGYKPTVNDSVGDFAANFSELDWNSTEEWSGDWFDCHTEEVTYVEACFYWAIMVGCLFGNEDFFVFFYWDIMVGCSFGK